jgi:hypothetical protein
VSIDDIYYCVLHLLSIDEPVAEDQHAEENKSEIKPI